MLFPQKHISLAKSYLGFGAHILEILSVTDANVDELWFQYCALITSVNHSYEDLIYTLDFLYSIGTIELNEKGRICLS